MTGSLSEVPNDLTLRVGQSISYPITSAGSVGYVWRLPVQGSAVAARTGPMSETNRPAHTGSLQQALFIIAICPGEAVIDMRLTRVPGQPPRETHRIEVKVIG